MEEKENLIFKYLSMLNEAECNFFYDMYRSFDTKLKVNGRTVLLTDEAEKRRFIENVEKYGFYIRKEHDSGILY